MRRHMKNKIRTLIHMLKEKNIQPIPQPINTTELLKNKVALITGGSGGIGLAIAKAFLQNGCQVIISGTSESKLLSIVSDLEDSSNVRSIVINVSDVKSLPDKINAASEMFGHIDILVNSAGINAHNDFFNVSEEEYDSVMSVNAKGTFFMCQAVAKYMVANNIKGHILNVTSSSALRPAKTPYHVSKWAVKGFTLGAADILLPYGIIVNAIAPGPVATPMLDRHQGDSLYKEGQPSGRYAMPSEIANMAVMLVSDMGDLIVGDTLYMTGGSGVLSLHN